MATSNQSNRITVTDQNTANSPDGDTKLISEDAQAAQFERVREAHKTETIEDYLELIDDLITAKGEARVVDLAKRMGVSQATVNKTIIRLARDGLVTSEPYRSIFLTDEGRAIATKSRARHDIVLSFLLSIGVSADIAALDAEGIEHHCSDETLAALSSLTQHTAKSKVLSRDGPPFTQQSRKCQRPTRTLPSWFLLRLFCNILCLCGPWLAGVCHQSTNRCDRRWTAQRDRHHPWTGGGDLRGCHRVYRTWGEFSGRKPVVRFYECIVQPYGFRTHFCWDYPVLGPHDHSIAVTS